MQKIKQRLPVASFTSCMLRYQTPCTTSY